MVNTLRSFERSELERKFSFVLFLVLFTGGGGGFLVVWIMYEAIFFIGTCNTMKPRTWSRTHAQINYLTIRPVALSGYGSIAHEAKPNGLLIRGP